MRKFSIGQLRVLSNFFNTIAAAWFTGGIITPFFLKPASLLEKITLSSVGLFFAFVFLTSSLFLARRIES